MKRCGIVLVNWKGAQDTIECLESLLRLDFPDYRVVVCDNDSGDGSVEQIVAWAQGRTAASEPPASPLKKLVWPPVPKPVRCIELDRDTALAGGGACGDARLVVIRTGGNLGFAGGSNVGMRYLLGCGDIDGIWLLNNDTVVDPASLRALADAFARTPRLGICGSTLLYYDDPTMIQALGGGYYCRWIGLPWLFGRWRRLMPRHLAARSMPRLMNYVVGASMLVSREFIDQVGLMTEDYFLFFEETDWAWRARGRFELGWAPGSLVYHKIGRSIGTSTDPRRKSATCDYYALRNRLLFTRRHFPLGLPAIYCSVGTALLVRLLLGQRDRVRMIWRLLAFRRYGEGGLP